MKHRDGTLDLIRGLSALLVMLGHLRGFIFQDFCDLPSAGIITKAFYFATSRGHQAVMVFFVLSGYFVGGSVLSGLMKGSFTWRGYATSRLTRLWMVLIPALMLTLGIDMLGRQWNPGAYAGGFHECFMSGPMPGHPASWNPVTLFGNLFFLQTVSVPIFGSNSPLWSLANEFWYYLMFPLLAVAGVCLIKWQRLLGAIFQLLLFLLIVWWLPQGTVLGGLIWLMGACVWWLLWWMRETNNQRPECEVSTSEPGEPGEALTGMAEGKPETRDQRPETRDQRPETRDQRPETRDQRPETRDQRAETKDSTGVVPGPWVFPWSGMESHRWRDFPGHSGGGIQVAELDRKRLWDWAGVCPVDVGPARQLANTRVVHPVHHWSIGNFLHTLCRAFPVVVFRCGSVAQWKAVSTGRGRVSLVWRVGDHHPVGRGEHVVVV